MKDFARYELIGNQADRCYKVELIMNAAEVKLSDLYLHLDLKSIFSINQAPFLLAVAPSLYWGKKVTVIHIDGILSEKTIEELEKNIVSYTGIPVDKMLKAEYVPKFEEHEQVTAVQFAQLLIGWRFLELINSRLAS